MELKYSQAIKAGIIAGVIVAILIIVRDAMSIIGSWTVEAIGFVGCCIWLVEILALLGAGILAVRFAAGMLKDMNDALMAGAVAGGVAGAIAAAAQVIMAFITPFITKTTYNVTETFGESLGLAGLGSIFGGFATLCCCAPIYIVVAVVLGAIGGVIYYALAGKK